MESVLCLPTNADVQKISISYRIGCKIKIMRITSGIHWSWVESRCQLSMRDSASRRQIAMRASKPELLQLSSGADVFEISNLRGCGAKKAGYPKKPKRENVITGHLAIAFLSSARKRVPF